MASLKLLVDEIDLIALHMVLRSVGDDTVRRWSHTKKCQIPKLVSYLAKSLSEDGGIETFERFCRTPNFSKAVADIRPGLLQQLLARELNEPEKSSMHLICFRLLSTQPLKTSGVPTDFPRFLEKIIRAIHQFPTVDLLYAIRDIVAQQSARVLELVSDEVLVDFIQTCKLLTQGATSNWYEAAVLSIDIGSEVCEAFSSDPAWLGNYTGTPKGSNVFYEWALKMSEYYDGAKAARFIYSICGLTRGPAWCILPLTNICISGKIYVLHLGKSNHSDVDTSKSPRHRLRDLERFRVSIRELSSKNHCVVEKVWRNTAGESLDFSARLSAFAVASKITSEGAYLDNVEAVLEQLIAVIVSEDEPCITHLNDKALSQTKQLTESLCTLLANDRKPGLEILRKIVGFILRRCRVCQYPDADTYSKTCTAAILLQALIESMNKHQQVLVIVMQILGKVEFSNWLEDLSASSEFVLEVNCRGSLVCTRDLFVLRNQLCHDFSILLLHGACTTASTISIKEFIFLQQKALSCKLELSAKRYQYSAEVDNSAFITPPPPAPRIEGDWRQQIVDIMENLHRQSAEAVFDQVNTVCLGFEERCETIEEPLRQAEARAAQLRGELEHTKTRQDLQEDTNSGLTKTIEKDRLAIREKDVENSSLKKNITKIQKIVQKHNDKIAQLTVELVSMKQEHANKIAEIRAESANMKQELELLNKAERFVLEDQVEAQKQEVAKTGATVAWLESEMHKLVEENKADHKADQAMMVQMKSEHELAYNSLVEQSKHLETKLKDRDTVIMELKLAIDEHKEELCGSIERLYVFERNETEWAEEKSELQKCLQAAEAKEKKVLAAIRGKEQEQDSCIARM